MGENQPRLETKTTHRSTKDWEINYRIFTHAFMQMNPIDQIFLKYKFYPNCNNNIDDNIDNKCGTFHTK